MDNHNSDADDRSPWYLGQVFIHYKECLKWFYYQHNNLSDPDAQKQQPIPYNTQCLWHVTILKDTWLLNWTSKLWKVKCWETAVLWCIILPTVSKFIQAMTTSHTTTPQTQITLICLKREVYILNLHSLNSYKNSDILQTCTTSVQVSEWKQK